MGKYTNVLYEKAARMTTVVCGFLFSLFSFVYLYVFQRDVLEALHFSLAHGKTHFAPMGSAVVITLILLLLRWGINSLLGLKGYIRSLSYLPSFLVLCALTDVGRTVYMSAYHTVWSWLLPVLILIFVVFAYWLRGLYRNQLNTEGSRLGLVNYNLLILFVQCLITVLVGNTNRAFHHELEVERYLRDREYVEALEVGKRSLESTHTLTALRAMAMAHAKLMGEKLFEYPQYYGVDGLFFDEDSTAVLRFTNDSVYDLLGGKPYVGDKPLDYLSELCYTGRGKYIALDYYLAGLLLDKQINKFAQTIDDFYESEDSLPRYYREAMAIYRSNHSDSVFVRNDSVMQEKYIRYKTRQMEFASPLEEQNYMKREFGDTYWWYFDYQK